MRIRGIPEKRIGPAPGSWERSIRWGRHEEARGGPGNAAERSACVRESISLCGIEEKKRKTNMKRR